MKPIFVFLLLFSSLLFAEEQVNLIPHSVNAHYGEHERQIFDLWLPKSRKPTPLVIFIHGGGFVMGSKDDIKNDERIIKAYLKMGYAFAAINYRYLKHTSLQNIMREDMAGFVQFMRFHHKEFNIDKKKIMSMGFSAGGSASLWLATHDDIADSMNENPLKRESSRLLAAAHLSAQAGYDFIDWFDYFGEEQTRKFLGKQVWSRYHLENFDDLLTDDGKKIRDDLDSVNNMSADDAPLFIWNRHPDIKVEDIQDGDQFMHGPHHARILEKRATEVNLEHEFHYTNADPTFDVQLAVLNFFKKYVKL